MQVMLDESEEFGHTQDLDLMLGSMVPLINKSLVGEAIKTPKIGLHAPHPSCGLAGLAWYAVAGAGMRSISSIRLFVYSSIHQFIHVLGGARRLLSR